MAQLTAQLVHGFTSSLLLSKFDNPVETPEFHHELWELVCSDHPRVAIAAPRRHAKSTAVTHCFTLASVLFRCKSYVFIVSDTYDQAIEFLDAIKKEMVENEELVTLFGIKRFIKDAENDIIVQLNDGHQFRIKAYGAEQKVRGRKWRSKRPDLVICDDLENDEIVLNEERRHKFRSWFLNALLEVGSKDCHFRIVGTILHQDSLLARYMPKMGSSTAVDDGLRVTDAAHDHKVKWKSILYRAHNSDFSKILWPENYTQQWFEDKRAEKVAQGHPEGYSQEYLNQPIDDTLAYFRKEDLKNIEKRDEYLEYYVGADLAISEKDQRAFTAIVIAGQNANGVLKIVDVRRFRGDSLEICNEIFQVQERYQPVLFAIESENIAKSIGPFLYEQMGKFGKPYINLREMKIGGQDKIRRARSVQARTRAGKIEFDHEASWWPTFQEELLYFPRGTYSDQVDAFAWVGLLLDRMVELAGPEEYKQSIEDEDLDDFDPLMMGMNAIAGY